LDKDDKSYWVEKGREDEKIFCTDVAPLYGVDAWINPKKEGDVYANDLQFKKDNRICAGELKTVRTPFFLSHKYGTETYHTVSINHIDYIRYMSKFWFSDLYIFFYVDWPESVGCGRHVHPKKGLWASSIKFIDNLITSRKTGFIKYKKRKQTPGFKNAESSHLLDLRDLHEFSEVPALQSSVTSYSESALSDLSGRFFHQPSLF